jgi:glycosyltransferase involved in cell wall biosynthesis
MKKKILYLRTDIYNKPLIAGGSVSHTMGVLKGMVDLGYSVICASSLMLDQLKNLKLDALVVLKNPARLKFLRWKLNCILSNLFFTITTFRLCKKYKPDFLYQRYSILNCTGVIVSKLLQVPLVLEYNGSEVWLEKNWSSQKRWFSLLWLMQYCEKINIKYSSYIVVVSEALKEELIERGVQPHKILINPNGADVDMFNPAHLMHERELVRKKLNIENKCVIGFVGTFSVWHGINVLGEIIPMLVKNESQLHFLLIGDGPLCSSLKSALMQKGIGSDSVTFTGLLLPEQTRNYLAACDIYVCPTQPNPDGSRFFGSPTKLFEYLSMGKPTIASRLEQLQEIVSPAISLSDLEYAHEKNSVGILVEPTAQSFYAAVLAVSKMPNDSKEKMGSNARERICTYYTWQCHVKKIMQFIENKEK